MTRRGHRCAGLAFTLALALPGAAVAQVRAVHRAGQTFVTFTETGAAAYDVYRNSVKVATLDAFSGTNRYTNQGLVICDGCAPLAPNQGLLVWTPKTSGAATYEVRVGSTRLGSATVQETARARPAIVRTSAWFKACGQDVATFIVFEDYETWEHRQWGPYWHEFGVSKPAGGGAGEPLTLWLHSAGGHLEGYKSPLTYFVCDTSFLGGGIVVFPVDFGFQGVVDPYTGAERPSPWWSGYGNSQGVFVPWRERQLVRITQEVAARLKADTNRLYITGHSMGGQAAHIGYHYPEVWAAIGATVGLVGPCPGDPPNTMPVDVEGRPTVGDYYNLAITAPGSDKPPMTYHFGSNDHILPPCAYPPAMQAIEQAGQGLYLTWGETLHEPRPPALHLNHWRFKKNEAFPAFSNASGSTPLGTAVGQRNQQFDWSNIVDQPDRFEITLRTVDGSTQTVDVTIRNRQRFTGNATQRGVVVTPQGTRLVFTGGGAAMPPPSPLPPLPPPPECTVSIVPANATVPAGGGSGSVSVTASHPTCAWTATSSASWLTVTQASGTGSGSVSYTVAAHAGPAIRSATITVAGQVHTVTQGGVMALPPPPPASTGETRYFEITVDGTTWAGELRRRTP
jgi:hypothetical protein